jgi:hypothetical protein
LIPKSIEETLTSLSTLIYLHINVDFRFLIIFLLAMFLIFYIIVYEVLFATDPQKAASVQAMLADFFGENCGHFRPKERVSISWSLPHELSHFGC